MTRIVVPVGTMHCRSCELTLERAVKALPGVRSVRASVRKGTVAVELDAAAPADRTGVEDAIRGAGYEPGGREARPWISSDGDAWAQLVLGAFFALSLIVVARATGLLDLSFGTAGRATAGTALLIGLTAGFSTCMALIGGLVLGIAARHAERHPNASLARKMQPHFLFHAGRIASFFLLGGLLGTLGGFLALEGTALGVLTMTVAAVMLLLGLQVTELFPALSAVTLPAAVARALGLQRAGGAYSHAGSAVLGALSFFLPCGFTQAAQVSAVASGGFWPGALIMTAFALGTVPGLLGIAGLTSAVRGGATGLFFKTVGVLLVVFALFNFRNGYVLAGLPTPSLLAMPPAQTNVTVEGRTQVARMVQNARGYSPNVFTVRKGLPVRWEIEGTNPYSCSSALVAPSLRVNRSLKQGRNVIEFTPTEAGQIPFSCSMGMFAGRFIVTD